ncbi:MAG: hybrid sensor histidine kinase/response regulator, partial [Candidatus Gallimonas sp.]
MKKIFRSDKNTGKGTGETLSRFGWLVMVIVFTMVLTASIIVIFSVREKLSKELHENAKAEMVNISETLEKSVNANILSCFSQLRIVSSLISNYSTVNQSTRPEFVNILSMVSAGISFKNIGLLLESGDVIFDSDETYNIYSSVFAQKIIVEGKSYVDTLSLIDNGTYFAFGVPYSATESIARIEGSDDLLICGVVGIAEPVAFSSLFIESTNHGDNVIAISKEDGFIVCCSENAKEDEKPLNFVTNLQNKLSDEDFEQLNKAFESGDKSTLTVALNDRHDYFLTCSSFKGEEYLDRFRILVYIPTTLITQATDNLFEGLFGIILVMVALSILLSSVTAFVILINRNKKIMLKKTEKANELLSVAAKAANEASTAKSHFLSNISHDIRTPINGIMGMTGLALDNIDDKNKVEHCLNKIDGASKHLLALINDVLDISRIESGKTEIKQKSEKLGDLLSNCVSVVEGQYLEKGVELNTDFGPFDSVYYMVDALHLHQVLINILGNAVKFTPAGGNVSFSCKQLKTGEENNLQFVIEDNGCGMSKEFCKKIFEPFEQEESARRFNRGSGLGMTISKQLVTLMGGSISVESEQGKGSAFTVTLPAQPCAEPFDDRKEAADINTDVNGVKILLAEDNDLNREFVTERLHRNGAVVTPAGNGKIVYEIFRDSAPGNFDVILMDVMMPEMDGYAATQAIRALDRADAATIPIVALTANAFDEDLKKCLRSGMNEHIVKPFDFNRLYAVINRLTGRKREDGNAKVRSDPPERAEKAAEKPSDPVTNGGADSVANPGTAPASTANRQDLSPELERLYGILEGSPREVLARLNNERIIRKLLSKFLSDGSFSSLGAAIENGNATEAFLSAHTLKGICLNFSFNKLLISVRELTELLRNRQTMQGALVFNGDNVAVSVGLYP